MPFTFPPTCCVNANVDSGLLMGGTRGRGSNGGDGMVTWGMVDWSREVSEREERGCSEFLHTVTTALG